MLGILWMVVFSEKNFSLKKFFFLMIANRLIGEKLESTEKAKETSKQKREIM